MRPNVFRRIAAAAYALASRVFAGAVGLRGRFAPRSAKVFNEHVKLFAGFVNSIAVTLIAVAILRPLIDPAQAASLVYGMLGLALHAVAHYMTSRMKDEDR